MYNLFKNKYKPVVYKGHRGLLYTLNKNTSIFCSFTSKPSYFNIDLLPSINLYDIEDHKKDYLKFNVIVHNQNFKFQKNNKITKNQFANQLANFHFYFNMSKRTSIPVWFYNEND